MKPGYCKELVAYLLLMIAWDQATVSRGISLSSTLLYLKNLEYMRKFVSQPIRVEDFLMSFFGWKNYNNNIQNLPKSLLMIYILYFTYLYPNLDRIESLFIHFAAVIYKHNQVEVDLILLVLLN